MNVRVRALSFYHGALEPQVNATDGKHSACPFRRARENTHYRRFSVGRGQAGDANPLQTDLS